MTVADTDGTETDLLVQAPSGTELGCILPALGSSHPGSTAGVWSEGHRLAPTARLGGPRLRSGALLRTVAPAAPGPPASTVRLLVVNGPGAGRVIPLDHRPLTIGRDPRCTLPLTDPALSRRHAIIEASATGVTLRDAGSTNGTLIDGRPIGRHPRLLTPADHVRIGESALRVDPARDHPASTRPGSAGEVLLNRAPRAGNVVRAEVIELPTPAPFTRVAGAQWVAALLPVALGVILALCLHSLQFLIFAALGPVLMLSTGLGDRLRTRREHRRTGGLRRGREAAANAKAQLAVRAETLAWREAYPDPATAGLLAAIPGRRLWERGADDSDFLTVRLGLQTRDSLTQLRRGPELRPAGLLHDVPVVADLRLGFLGITGPAEVAESVLRWLVAQIALWHSPNEVELAVLLSDDVTGGWRWTRWLPHLRTVARTDDERRSLVSSLLREVDSRSTGCQAPEATATKRAWTVLLLDRVGSLSDLPGLADLLARGPSAGLTGLCLDVRGQGLPVTCSTEVQIIGEIGSRLQIRDQDRQTEAIADQPDGCWAERVSRALAPLRDAGACSAAGLPEESDALELLDLDPPTATQVRRRWVGHGCAAAPIGVSVGGLFEVDLDRDGPHALVAGTTGSGKSILLQTLVASLAVGNSPADMAFLLIDYKGGAAFGECARLPHTAGLVTDLDPRLTERALDSLGAELRRREALFAQDGAVDLRSYHDREPSIPIGRLVIVVDEFATLVEELPEFVNGLVNVARRGRSLGVHLVLATQRPSGAVSPEIRANTTLRIALRVTDRAESADVLGTNAAAYIAKDRPGRAIVRAGSALTEVQIARLGEPRPRPGAIVVRPLDAWGGELLASAGARDTRGTTGDLARLVTAVREAAHGIPAARSPWLPPLPDRIALSRLSCQPGSPRQVLAIGVIDDPRSQSQPVLTLDLARSEAVLIVGRSGSGRTCALRAMAHAGARHLSPDELQLYVLDFAGGGLGPLSALPHCGTAILGAEPEAAGRLLELLRARHRATTPRTLLLIDGLESFAAASAAHDGGHALDTLATLLRESRSLKLTIALSSGRGGLISQLTCGIADKYLLPLADRSDYGLAGISTRMISAELPPGRAVRVADGLQVQFAEVDSASAAPLRASRTAPAAHPPIRVRALPDAIRLAELSPTRVPGTVALGVGGDSAVQLDIDLIGQDRHWLIGGPSRSGRTTLLRVLLGQLRESGIAVASAAPQRSELWIGDGAGRATLLTPDAGTSQADEWIDTIRSLGSSPVVLIDDVESFLDTPAGARLLALTGGPHPNAPTIVATCRSDDPVGIHRGLVAELRRARTGVLLQPASTNTDLLGLRVPRQHSPLPAGRGLLCARQPQLPPPQHSGAIHVQVALP